MNMTLKKILLKSVISAVALGMLAAPALLAQGGSAPHKQAPPAGSPPKPFTVPAKQTFTLPNGLHVTMVPYGRLPKVAIAVVVRAGTFNEGPNQTWLSDLTARLIK